MKFFLYDETMMNTKAKITTEKLSAMSDIVSQKAQYITAAGAATPNQITIAAGVLIAVGSSVFKTVLTNLTTANLDTGSGFEMGTDYYIYCCDPTNGSDTVDRDEVFVISKNSTYPSGYTADNSRKIGGFHAIKGDIHHYFQSVAHDVLKKEIRRYISDKALLKILDRIIDHNGIFPPGVGIPVGNLTSQLFANVYLNKLDQYVKHVLKMKYYVRYMDDFIILSEDPEELRHVLELIEEFLRRELKLELNPKTTILAAKNGINFVGYIHFKDHKRVRKDAMRRLKKLLKAFDTGEVELEDFDRSIESRFGHTKHADSYILIEETQEKIKEIKERKATA